MEPSSARDQLREFPPTDASACFHDAAGRTAARSTELLQLGPPLPDPRAIFSVLQFGAVLPPLAPWQGIHRFVSGYRYQGTARQGPYPLEPPLRLEPLSEQIFTAASGPSPSQTAGIARPYKLADGSAQ